MLDIYIIQKGQTVIVHSEKTFSDRKTIAHKYTHDDQQASYIYAKEKILIDDIRDIAYQIQKESLVEKQDVQKLILVICDEIGESAQQALLKVLEDIEPDTCIILYAHIHSIFLPTVVSRSIIMQEKDASLTKDKWDMSKKTVAERFAWVKELLSAEEDTLSKQDIIQTLTHIQQYDSKKDTHKEIYVRAFSMLKQPSVSIKYVLEYVVGSI